MYDFAMPASRPGKCPKCDGTGTYSWGATVNGVPSHSGPCHSCRGTGVQTVSDIKRNNTYNRYKLAHLSFD